MMDKELLQILACPACRGGLSPLPDPAGQEQLEPEGLACRACALVYPVREQIPVLLKEEGVRRQEWEAGKRCAPAGFRGGPDRPI